MADPIINTAMDHPSTTHDRDTQLQRWSLFRTLAAAVVAARRDVPPFTVRQVFDMAGEAAKDHGVSLANEDERKVMAIMVHNEAWRETVAAVPYERRLLFLPQCLRSRVDCPAEMDAYGLLCQECGRCPLGALQREAVDLGYTVLIAEGSGAVSGLLSGGGLDAVIGVGCLHALEQSFRHIADEALPSLAIPLFRDGCDSSDVDLELLYTFIRLRSKVTCPPGVTVDALRARVQAWFLPERLRADLMPGDHHAQTVAMEWLCGAGRRWRPLLAVSVFDALQTADTGNGADLVRRVSVAAECFHKASLVHDDIEDNDDVRDSMPTLHRKYGIPVAINAGDLLLGEGYRLLSKAPLDPVLRERMLSVAADGHQRLCIGQGDELHWLQQRDMPGVASLLRLFSLKTGPAFEVAILLGAIAGGADPSVCAALSGFSEALGVAYQIRDDLQDMAQDSGWEQECVQRPSILLALLCEQCAPEDESGIRHAIRNGQATDGTALYLRQKGEQYAVVSKAEALLTEYRNRAIAALEPLPSVRLKSILIRIVKRILAYAPR